MTSSLTPSMTMEMGVTIASVMIGSSVATTGGEAIILLREVVPSVETTSIGGGPCSQQGRCLSSW